MGLRGLKLFRQEDYFGLGEIRGKNNKHVNPSHLNENSKFSPRIRFNEPAGE